jgi:glycosyltransferase involved in cell wall biosynthesis
MSRRKIVFWQQVASIHQACMLRSLAAQTDVEVTLVVDRQTPEWRRASGWFDAELGRVHVVYNDDEESTRSLLSSAIEAHVFSGLRSSPRRAFLRARGGRATLGLYVEPGDPRGALGVARRAIATIDAHRFRDDIDFVLAVGGRGAAWYRKCGYPAERIHRFGYFVDPAGPPETPAPRASPNLVFVGRLIRRKAVDIALSALAQLKGRPWTFDIVGDGPERARLEKYAFALGISDRVHFLGALANADARARLAGADVLLLPSREDGWGAVVNEALMCGVPVICSAACGASDLVAHDRGSVVKTDSVASLRDALADWTRAPLAPQARALIREWTTRITGEVAARYLLDVLAYVERGGHRPTAPWLLP